MYRYIHICNKACTLSTCTPSLAHTLTFQYNDTDGSGHTPLKFPVGEEWISGKGSLVMTPEKSGKWAEIQVERG